MYKVYNISENKYDESFGVFFSREEAWEALDYLEHKDQEYKFNYNVVQYLQCKTCSNEGETRYDYYGISTGVHCDTCYTSPNYKYRKDRYPTMEYDGYGDTLG
jgi:hypothetical protein